MKDRWLYPLAFAVSALCGVVIAVSPFVSLLRMALVGPLIYIAAAVAILLFLRMLIDPVLRKGINAAHVEMYGNELGPQKRKIRFFDKRWGFLGSRVGSPSLVRLRATLLIEFTLAILLSGPNGGDVLVLSFAAAFIAMMLSIIHVGLNMPTT